jgi:hypothetical protein
LIASGFTGGCLDDAQLDTFTLDGSLLRGDGKIINYYTRFINLSLFADGILKYTEQVKDNRPFSMPSGYKSSLYEIRITGNITVYSASFAETSTGLKIV